MQNSTSNSSLPFSTTSLSANWAAYLADLARASEPMRAGFLADLLLSTDTSHADEVPDEESAPCGPAAPDAVAAPKRAHRVTLDELLPLFREPIMWALSRAQREALEDPHDLAAVTRVREAYQVRLLWLGLGGALRDVTAGIRPTDLLIVAHLVMSSIDPSFFDRVEVALRQRFPQSRPKGGHR